MCAKQWTEPGLVTVMMKRKLAATLDAVFAALVRHAEGSAPASSPAGRG